jgi:hypothetical protein
VILLANTLSPAAHDRRAVERHSPAERWNDQIESVGRLGIGHKKGGHREMTAFSFTAPPNQSGSLNAIT